MAMPTRPAAVSKTDIPVSPGEAVTTVDDAVAAADRIGYPVVVKAQVHVGGRGKAGGVKLAADTAEAREHATNILGLDIKGHVVKTIWIESASDIAEEYYASFTLDRAAKKHLGMLSAEGGVEIETVAEENPDAIAKIWIDPVDGLTEAAAREWVEAANLNPEANDGAVDILLKLYRAYTEGDADLCEINPLILKPTGEVHALDAKVTLDGNAQYRHEGWEAYEATQVRDDREQAAHDKGLQYVGLDGSVGVLANGAGLTMTTMDAIRHYGGEPANFLDVGGGATAEKVTEAFKLMLHNPELQAILVNIFGGIMKCDVIAEGVVMAARQVELTVPLIVRLEGTNVALGKKILAESGLPIISADNMADAAKKAVTAAASFSPAG